MHGFYEVIPHKLISLFDEYELVGGACMCVGRGRGEGEGGGSMLLKVGTGIRNNSGPISYMQLLTTLIPSLSFLSFAI